MAGDWIKMRTKLARDGRVREMSRKCHTSRVTVCGALYVTWSLADEYAQADGLMVGYTTADLDSEVELPGFCAAMPPEWMRVDENGAVYLPDYQRHNGDTAKKRADATIRKRLSRSRSGHKDVTDSCDEGPTDVTDNCDILVTKAGPEKRRGINTNTPLAPQGGTGEIASLGDEKPKIAKRSRPKPEDNPVAAEIVEHYVRLVGSENDNLVQGRKNVASLLQKGESAADLKSDAAKYALHCQKNQREPSKRTGVSNFYGQKAEWKTFREKPVSAALQLPSADPEQTLKAQRERNRLDAEEAAHARQNPVFLSDAAANAELKEEPW